MLKKTNMNISIIIFKFTKKISFYFSLPLFSDRRGEGKEEPVCGTTVDRKIMSNLPYLQHRFLGNGEYTSTLLRTKAGSVSRMPLPFKAHSAGQNLHLSKYPIDTYLGF